MYVYQRIYLRRDNVSGGISGGSGNIVMCIALHILLYRGIPI